MIKLLYIYTLILFFIYLIFYNLFTQNIEPLANIGKKLEKGTKDVGKGTKDISKDTKDVGKDVGKGAEKTANKATEETKKVGDTVQKGLNQLNPLDAIKQIISIVKDLKKNVDNMQNEIEAIPTQIDDTIAGKFTNFFKQFGDILNSGLVEPLNSLFIGIGNIFMQIFSIFIMIGNKITSLPGCILYFIFDGIFASIYGVFKLILPNFLMKWIIDPIANLFGLILDFIGYTSGSKKCYAFDVNQQVSKMNKDLTNIDTSFKQNFGKLDFSKISV